jgi:hypothetical protein
VEKEEPNTLATIEEVRAGGEGVEHLDVGSAVGDLRGDDDASVMTQGDRKTDTSFVMSLSKPLEGKISCRQGC